MPCSICEITYYEGEPQCKECANPDCWSLKAETEDDNIRVVCVLCSPNGGIGEGEDWLCDICYALAEAEEEEDY
jgi:hypothetical protein